MATSDRHLKEMLANRRTWEGRPGLRDSYGRYYGLVADHLPAEIRGSTVELGSGMGNARGRIPNVILTDLFPNSWLDVACDAIRMPFPASSLSALVLLDVFHHLARPGEFLKEAARVLAPGGRVILVEPFISLAGWLVYGLIHAEPVGWGRPIDLDIAPARGQASDSYYAAQGNATRLFFKNQKPGLVEAFGFRIHERSVFADFAWWSTGGFSGPNFDFPALRPTLRRFDRWASGWPNLFGARCLVVLERV